MKSWYKQMAEKSWDTSIHDVINERFEKQQEEANIKIARTCWRKHVVTQDTLTDFVLANEYMDFLEFLEDELDGGIEELRLYQRKFFKQQAQARTKFELDFSSPKKLAS